MIFVADYKRLISYIYSYERGRKSNNVGYVRVESRNDMCKVTINFKLRQIPVIHPLKVYFLKREYNKLTGILLGTAQIAGTSCDFRDMVETYNINKSGVNLEEICGVYICDGINRNLVYAAEWDNRNINPEMFYIYKKDKAGKAGKAAPQEEKLKVDNSVIELVEDYVKQSGDEIDKESQDQNLVSARAEEQTEPGESQEKQDVGNQKDENKIFNTYEYENIAMEPEGNKCENIWDFLNNKYTKIVGIKNYEDIECIKIKPQDLASLPNKYWVLGNNSFLLHGYYNYRYLLFAKVGNREENGQRYKLGVPGIYHRNEKMMASMFGFNEFLEADQNSKNGEVMGYWCMDILVND